MGCFKKALLFMKHSVYCICYCAGLGETRDVDSMSVLELKAALDSMHISHVGLAEKSELKDKVRQGRAMQQIP